MSGPWWSDSALNQGRLPVCSLCQGQAEADQSADSSCPGVTRCTVQSAHNTYSQAGSAENHPHDSAQIKGGNEANVQGSRREFNMKSCRRVRAALSHDGRILKGGRLDREGFFTVTCCSSNLPTAKQMSRNSKITHPDLRVKRREGRDGFGCCGLRLGTWVAQAIAVVVLLWQRFNQNWMFFDDFGKCSALGQCT